MTSGTDYFRFSRGREFVDVEKEGFPFQGVGPLHKGIHGWDQLGDALQEWADLHRSVRLHPKEHSDWCSKWRCVWIPLGLVGVGSGQEIVCLLFAVPTGRWIRTTFIACGRVWWAMGPRGSANPSRKGWCSP